MSRILACRLHLSSIRYALLSDRERCNIDIVLCCAILMLCCCSPCRAHVHESATVAPTFTSVSDPPEPSVLTPLPAPLSMPQYRLSGGLSSNVRRRRRVKQTVLPVFVTITLWQALLLLRIVVVSTTAAAVDPCHRTDKNERCLVTPNGDKYFFDFKVPRYIRHIAQHCSSHVLHIQPRNLLLEP